MDDSSQLPSVSQNQQQSPQHQSTPVPCTNGKNSEVFVVPGDKNTDDVEEVDAATENRGEKEKNPSATATRQTDVIPDQASKSQI